MPIAWHWLSRFEVVIVGMFISIAGRCLQSARIVGDERRSGNYFSDAVSVQAGRVYGLAQAQLDRGVRTVQRGRCSEF